MQRVLEHDFLLVKLFLFCFQFLHASGQELNLLSSLVQFVVQIFRLLLLFLCLVSYTADFRLDLEDFVVSLLDELLDGLERLVSLLHAEETLLPVLQQRLLAHHDSFNLDGRLLECVSGSCSFFLLGDQLCLVERLLLVQALNLLIHCVNEQILLLLGLFEVADVLLGAIGRAASHSDLALHHLVVLLNLFECTVELI